MDLAKLSKGDKIVVGGALLFFIAMFLDWFSVDIRGITLGSVNGWDYGFWGVLMFLLLLAAAALCALPAFGVKLKAPAIVVLAVGVFVAVMELLKVLIGESSTSRGIGLFLAFVAALVVAFGGFTKYKESGGSIEDLKDPSKLRSQMQTGFGDLSSGIRSAGSGGSTPPPPPPPPPPPETPPPPPPPPPPA